MCLTASLFGSGCGLYDRSLLDPAEGTAPRGRANADVRTRKPALSYAAAIAAAAGSGSVQQTSPPSDERQDTPAKAARQSPKDTTLADNDAGLLPMPMPMPRLLEERPECGARAGYVEPQSRHCYIPITEELSWFRARDLCVQRQSHLASITKPEEQAFVASLPRSGPTWIGLSRFGTEGFSWITGESVSFAAWGSGAPSARTEGGGMLREDMGTWLDAPPSEMHRGLCEREPGP